MLRAEGRNRRQLIALCGEPRRREIMAETATLTDHRAIRNWASIGPPRGAGFPVVIDASPEAGTQPLLRFVFGQRA